MFERSCRIAAGLGELGIAPGERVVVTMANSPDVGVLYQALWRAGAVVTPATFLLPPEDLRHVVANAEAAAVVTSPEFADKVREAVTGLDCVRSVISSGDVDSDDVLPLASLEQADPAPIVERADSDLAALLYTGGTTGRAKGVMLSHDNLYFSGRAGYDAGHVPGINRSLATLPLSHAYGLLVTIVGMHAEEQGVAALLRWFDPQAFLSLIQEHRLQQSAVVPSMLQILLSQPLEDYDLSDAPVPVLRGRAARARGRGGGPPPGAVGLDPAGLRLTESAALIATNPAGREKSGSVGIPVPGTTVRIVDDEGHELGAGEPGEICARSPGVMNGYWRSPEVTAEALRDGWLHTGDVGYLDADGYLFIVDRMKDLIIRGGFNVYPRDVEDGLLEHPAVEMAAVVGKPDALHGEEVVAFVSLRNGQDITGEELVDWARSRIGGYKYPREVRVLDSIPLTPVGKIDRKVLRSNARHQAPNARRDLSGEGTRATDQCRPNRPLTRRAILDTAV